ncbi:MAG: hypothetical protein HY976_00640 [Candidatus Kerfeldbacteria bacterium]|nr:hypothetical protein [Candidatus Kerfeldbacteria bacterium]
MDQTKSVAPVPHMLGPLAVIVAVAIVAMVVAGEFNLSFTWSLIATALPLLVVITFDRARATYREYQSWYGRDDPAIADITADARYHCILGSVGFGLAVLGSATFYARGIPWWIAGCLIISIVCLLLGPVEDEPQGE